VDPKTLIKPGEPGRDHVRDKRKGRGVLNRVGGLTGDASLASFAGGLRQGTTPSMSAQYS